MLIRRETRSGFPVFVKRAETDAEAARLNKEAGILARLDCDGVTRLHPAGIGGGAEPVKGELASQYVGRHDLSTFHSTRDWEWLFILRSAAEVLGQLHQRGITHGAITAQHILLDHRRRPVLCSFGRSVELDENGIMAQADVFGLMAAAREKLHSLPAGNPGWATRMRDGNPRLLAELQNLLAHPSRPRTAIELSWQLGQLTDSAGLGATHADEVWERELQPAVLAASV